MNVPSTLTIGGREVSRPVLIAGIIGLIAVALALAAGVTILATRPSPAVAVASPTPSPTPEPTPTATPRPTPKATPSASPTPKPTPKPVDLLGADGRFTVLLLGSDYRASHPGNRMDAIMVVSLDPVSGAVAAASIPRDTVNFPTSTRRNYSGKVNALYQSLVVSMGQEKAAKEMKRIVGDAIGVDVDRYAVIGFEGVRQMVDVVGGVDVVLQKAYTDPYYWVTASRRGVHFPAGRSHLDGNTALIFSRTRKGDGDFARAGRQQLLIAGAAAAVRERGLENLPALVKTAERWVTTDIPMRAAPQLFEMVAKADLANAEGVVWGPRTWATYTGRSFALNLPRIREWTRTYMAPVQAAAANATKSAAP